MKTMCRLQFPNGEIVFTHLWNGIELNKCLKITKNMKTKILLFVAIMSITLTFAQSKQIDKVLNNSKDGVTTVYKDGTAVVKTVYNDVKSLSPKVEKAIGSLAEQFKTTTNNVWKILVRQQLVWSIGFLILTLTSIFNWFIFYKNNNKTIPENKTVTRKRDIIDDIPNPRWEKYYSDRSKEYSGDIRSKEIIKGKVGEEEYVVALPTKEFKYFKYLHLTICIGLSGLSIYHFSDMLTGFINPEFGALKTIAEIAVKLK